MVLSHVSSDSIRVTEENNLRILDAPGIDEASTSTDPEQAQRNQNEAENAVLQSDLVILCFDTQNQKASEFSQVLKWVHEFSKPWVSVLNVRNALWRSPFVAEVCLKKEYNYIKRQLRFHRRHLRDSLATSGTSHPTCPIFAIVSKMAAFACCDEYDGPGKDERDALLSFVTKEQLAHLSGFPALWKFLTEFMKRHARESKIQSMSNFMFGKHDKHGKYG